MGKAEFKQMLTELIESGELEIIPVNYIYPYDNHEYRSIEIKIDKKRIMEIDEIEKCR